MNNKKIKKINEYLEDNENYLITENNFKFRDISQEDIQNLLEKIKKNIPFFSSLKIINN